MPNGYWDRILRVDLSTGRLSEDHPGEAFFRQYLGGRAVVAHVLLNELTPGTDPLGPKNKLIFAPGVLTGTPVAGPGKNSVGARSPLTGCFGEGEVGGYWGAELKRAGFDGLIVEGQSEKPVYLWIRDGKAELRDADRLWGKTTLESQELLRQELGERFVRTAQIGPAGERLVRYACVVNDCRDVAGRTGLGAVMGAKRLKAIAVRGKMTIPMAEGARLATIAKWLTANVDSLIPDIHRVGTGYGVVPGVLSGNLPTKNFTDGEFPDGTAIDAYALRDQVRIGMEACFGCAVRCKKVVELKGDIIVSPAYGGPEYETIAAFGPNLGVADLTVICKAHELCNAYGMDTISAGATIAFAMECFEHGLLTPSDTDGLDLRFGRVDVILPALEKIARREGLGNLLAEGVKRASERIGRGAEEFALHVKGQEIPMHEPRLKQGLGLGYAISPTGAEHQCNIHDTLFEKETAAMCQARAVGILDPLPASDLSPAKVRLLTYMTNSGPGLNNCLVMCDFLPYSLTQKAEMVRAVTGWNVTDWELVKVGERAASMARVFNVREGLTHKDDVLPKRFFRPPRRGPLARTAIDPQAFEEAKREYYRMMGWTTDGVPTRAKLHELGLPWVADLINAP